MNLLGKLGAMATGYMAGQQQKSALEAETSPLVERRPVAAAQRNALGGMRLD
jgi:hypothetical protein